MEFTHKIWTLYKIIFKFLLNRTENITYGFKCKYEEVTNESRFANNGTQISSIKAAKCSTINIYASISRIIDKISSL